MECTRLMTASFYLLTQDRDEEGKMEEHELRCHKTKARLQLENNMKSFVTIALLLSAALVRANYLKGNTKRKLLCGGNTLGAKAKVVEFGGGVVGNQIESNTTKSVPVQYRVTFENLWTTENHPPNYPSGAHWSPPVGATHDCNYEMWNANETASEGVVIVAETGSTGVLRSELSAEQEVGNVLDSFMGRGMFGLDVTPTQTFDISVDESHSLVSMVTMIAPSPDWFAGVHGLETTSNGVWWESFTVDLQPYDAGSDRGNTYSARNDPLEPQLAIKKIITDSYPSTEVFVKDGEVLPVARLSFELLA